MIRTSGEDDVKDAQGFTLIELMVVVAVIGALLMITIPNYLSYIRASRNSVCISNMRAIRNAVITYIYVDSREVSPDGIVVSDLVPDYIMAEPVCPLGFETKLPGGRPHPGGGSPPGLTETYEITQSGDTIIVSCPNADPKKHDVNE